MHRFSLLALPLVLIGASAASQDEPKRVDKAPNAGDIAMTPIQDLNLSSDPIPPILIAAEDAPYANENLSDCSAIGDEIARLTAVLGPDLDIENGKDGLSVGKVAKSAVGSLIPFRGVVREITGAADKQREFQAAILAGAVRRGYLKGLGEAKDCPYPARPAFVEIQVEDEEQVIDD
ncbi:hypothetical protein [Erythrobacter litoralis]|uniref:Uncharacterized protein n=1 Tax=Erythrobacter litoralis (strain HTCC2594) TaxID=314225 RepID=Q2N9X6_ERYLH|nr:hypothetical protein [Erythrobacter litoralis]ABC63515.1 hypothetical protein ELI_07115 [Erythrobacter litoralis HTCC2594]